MSVVSGSFTSDGSSQVISIPRNSEFVVRISGTFSANVSIERAEGTAAWRVVRTTTRATVIDDIDAPGEYRITVRMYLSGSVEYSMSTERMPLGDVDDSDVTASELAAGVVPKDRHYPELNVNRYGAIGDNETDCLEAFNDAYRVALSKAASGHGAEVYIPEGKYRLSGEWNVYRANSPRTDITIRGEDQLNSILIANFYGAGLALISCVDPLGATRASPLSIRDLGFQNVSTSGGVNPVFINVLGWGESRIDRVRFAGSNNTHVRAVSAQNVRGTDIVSFFGGRHFNYKNTSGFTFTVDTGANTITASGAIFAAGDVGKYFFVFPTNTANRIRYLITGFTSSTVVSYTGNDISATASEGHFEPARCSMTSGDATLTANAACFTSDMVGLVLYVRGARAGSFGNALLRGVITAFNSTTSVELDVTAGVTVTDAYFSVACIDMGLPPAWDGSSDVKFDKLHVEHYDGVAFVAQNVDSYHISGKIHGETTPSDSAKSMAACWLDDFGGKFEVDLDSSCSMSDTRVHASNFNDMTMFDALWSRHIVNGTLFKSDAFTDAGGYLIVRGLNLYEDTTDPYDYIVDANFVASSADPRILLEGATNMLGDAEKARLYEGRSAYFLPDGRFVYGPSTVGATYDMTLSGATGVRMLFEDIGTRRWSIGNTPGGGQSFIIRDETAPADRIGIGATGTLFPGTDAAQDLGAAANRWSRTYAAQLAITDGVTAPGNVTGFAVIYVDTADGDLKVRFPDGIVKTLATDA